MKNNTLDLIYTIDLIKQLQELKAKELITYKEQQALNAIYRLMNDVGEDNFYGGLMLIPAADFNNAPTAHMLAAVEGRAKLIAVYQDTPYLYCL